MKILLFDPVGGASGDMILGSLIHLGCPPDYLASIWDMLPVFRGVSKNILRISERKIHGIAALNPQFFFQDAINPSDPASPCSGTAESRSFRDIMDMLEHAPLPDAVRNHAIGIFTCLAKAEGAVHQAAPESVHFHEIGALDSILDIVGIAAAVEWFCPDAILTRPPPLGHGITSSRHGPIPIPAPATVSLLHDMRVRFTDIESELTTPTGAAVLKFLAREAPPLHELTIDSAGYGCGTRTFENWPNLFRSILCSSLETSVDNNIFVVETDVDDMIPEDWEAACRNLYKAGALDASLAFLQMKKGRPGMEVRVVVHADHVQPVIEALFTHTTTIGIRYYPVNRVILPRQIRTIRTSFGDVRIKEAILSDGRKRFKAEMDDLERYSRETGRPVSELRKEIERILSQENGA